jgi:hypothetical protein
MIVSRKHDYKTLVPGQTYIIKSKDANRYFQNFAGVYEQFKVNFYCQKLNEGYSPDFKYFNIIRNNIIIQPHDVKLNDIVTLRHKWIQKPDMVDLTVNYIYYTYFFSTQIFNIVVYSNDVNIYDTMQTVMEKRTIAQLPLIDDVIGVINKFI